MERQSTIRREVRRTGIGLHSGRKVLMRLRPAPAGAGIRFVRSDLGGIEIPATPEFLDECNYATLLSRGEASVSTVEHLLSAVTGRGLDNLTVELDGPEVPILDGSAEALLEILDRAGRRELAEPRRFLQVTRPVSIVAAGKEILIQPSSRLQISYLIDFPHPSIGRQELTVQIDPQTYAREIAPARTFTFVREVDALREAGLARGGSLTNAVVLDDKRLLNSVLRFDDEFVRHKILDLLGDLALVGHPVLGHVMAFKAGHDLHGRLVSELLSRKDAWRLVEAPLAVFQPRPGAQSVRA